MPTMLELGDPKPVFVMHIPLQCVMNRFGVACGSNQPKRELSLLGSKPSEFIPQSLIIVRGFADQIISN